MDSSGHSFIQLLIIIGLSFLVPIVLSRVRKVFIPIVIGEVIAGVIIGKSGLGIVKEDIVLEILSSLGFIFLMFLSGIELDISKIFTTDHAGGQSRIKKYLGNNLFLGTLMFGITLVLAHISSRLLHRYGLVPDIWIMTLILSTTSLGVVVPVLKEHGVTGERLGQLMIVSALVADFASIFLISIYVIFMSHGISSEILLVLLLLAIFAGGYRIAHHLQSHKPTGKFIEEISSETSQIKLRGAFALALLFIVLAESVGTENLIGAFLAGVIVSIFPEGEDSVLKQNLDAIGYGFFIPVFFIMVGVSFDLPALLEKKTSLLLVPILVLIAYLVKFVSALVFKISFSWRETFSAGALLSSRLTLLIAAATIGLKLGVVGDVLYAAIILVAIITCLVSPVLFGLIMPGSEKERGRVVVVGKRKFAELLTQRLRRHNLNAVLLGTDPINGKNENSDSVQNLSLRKLFSAELEKAGIEKAGVVVVMHEDDDLSLRLCRIARYILSADTIIAWVQDPARNSEFKDIGVSVVNPVYSTLIILESLVLNPDAFSMIPDVDKDVEVRDFKLRNEKLVGVRVGELGLPKNVNILIINRMGYFMVPDGQTILRSNDVVTLMGPAVKIRKSFGLLENFGNFDNAGLQKS